MDRPTLEDVRRARERIAASVRRTPTVPADDLLETPGHPLLLKCENLQVTGAFKARGALNRMLRLSRAERERGVVTFSAGNHARAVAWAGRRSGTATTVMMPRTAPRTKVEACRAWGARVELHDDVFRAWEAAEALASSGATMVHPFDHRDVVAGQGTVALEVLEEAPRPAAVVVPVGGGGLCAGACLALADQGVPVWGVEPEGADAMCRSLEAGRPVRLERVDTVADGLGAPMAGELTFPLIRDGAAGVVRVPDGDIRTAMGRILERAKLLVEPAGAAAVAALLTGRIPLPAAAPDRPVVALLSGGNVDLDRLPVLLDLPPGA